MTIGALELLHVNEQCSFGFSGPGGMLVAKIVWTYSKAVYEIDIILFYQTDNLTLTICSHAGPGLACRLVRRWADERAEPGSSSLVLTFFIELCYMDTVLCPCLPQWLEHSNEPHCCPSWSVSRHYDVMRCLWQSVCRWSVGHHLTWWNADFVLFSWGVGV